MRVEWESSSRPSSLGADSGAWRVGSRRRWVPSTDGLRNSDRLEQGWICSTGSGPMCNGRERPDDCKPAAAVTPPARQSSAVKQKTHWTASHWQSLSVLYLGYATNIFGLTAFDVTNGLRLADASLGLDNVALGQVLSTGAIVYLVGKLVNGIVTDALGGQLTSCCSLFTSAVSLLVLSFAKTPTMVTVAWSLCRFAQAAAWPGIMSSTKQWFQGNGMGTAIGIVSTSSRSGAIVGNLLLAPLLRSWSWRSVLRVASTAALCTCTCLRLGLRTPNTSESPAQGAVGPIGMEGPTSPRSAAGRAREPERTMCSIDLRGMSSDQDPTAQSSMQMVEFYRSGALEPQLIAAYESSLAISATKEVPPQSHGESSKSVLPVSVFETLKVTLCSPRLLACFCSNALATSVYQFASLLPLMLTQAGSFTSDAAAQAAALYPLGAFGSIFVATSLWDTVLSSPLLRMLYLSGGTAASCLAMGRLSTVAARSRSSAMALLMVVMAGVSPVYYISKQCLAQSPSCDCCARSQAIHC